jgi:hypothetical protein
VTKKTIEDELAQKIEEAIDQSGDPPSPPPGAIPVDTAAPPTHAPPAPVKRPHPYGELARILNLALDQASKGKGKQRHAFGPIGFRPWHEQPILANARQVGPGGPALQVMKKIQEATNMAGNGNYDGALTEALGTIVYAAAFYKLVEEMKSAMSDPNPGE